MFRLDKWAFRCVQNSRITNRLAKGQRYLFDLSMGKAMGLWESWNHKRRLFPF